MSHYKLNGKQLPSVTTIISDCTDKSGPLTQWAANQTTLFLEGFRDEISPALFCKLSDDLLNDARFKFRHGDSPWPHHRLRRTGPVSGIVARSASIGFLHLPAQGHPCRLQRHI